MIDKIEALHKINQYVSDSKISENEGVIIKNAIIDSCNTTIQSLINKASSSEFTNIRHRKYEIADIYLRKYHYLLVDEQIISYRQIRYILNGNRTLTDDEVESILAFFKLNVK